MDENYSKSRVLSSLFWKLLERGGTQGIQFLVQIMLARLLLPEQFGAIAIVMVFINLAQVFIESGFNTALIQKKSADEVDFSSIFFVSLLTAGIMYLLIFLGAPAIAGFYQDLLLIPVLRIISLTLFAGAFTSIQNAYIARHLLFRKLFISSLGAILLSGVIGILAALQGFGIWALVIQHLVNQFAIAAILWVTVKWRPRLVFSLERVKILFSFGWKLLASHLVNVFVMELRPLIVGRLYAPSTLGYYNRGQLFPRSIVSNVDGSIQTVMLPTLAAHQDDPGRVKEIMRRAVVSSSFLIFPMMIGLAVIADPLVRIILTDKWLPAVPFLQIFCFTYALMPIHTSNLQAINAMGRSDIFLKLELIKKSIGLIILFVSLPLGVYAIAIGEALSGVIGSFINAYPNRRLLNYSYKEQWGDLLPSLLISFAMGGLVHLISFLGLGTGLQLILQVFSGGVIYLLLARLFKVESYRYLKETLMGLLKARKLKSRVRAEHSDGL